jgi:hypothetical protein
VHFLATYEKWQFVKFMKKQILLNNVMAIDNINFYPTRVDSMECLYAARNENTTTFIKNKIKMIKDYQQLNIYYLTEQVKQSANFRSDLQQI